MSLPKVKVTLPKVKVTFKGRAMALPRGVALARTLVKGDCTKGAGESTKGEGESTKGEGDFQR